MSQKEKLLKKIINNPKDVRFHDLCKILKWDGWVISSTSSSHYTYEKTEAGRMTIVREGTGKVKSCYVREVLKLMGAV